MKNYPIQNANSTCFGVYMKKRFFLSWFSILHLVAASCFSLDQPLPLCSQIPCHLANDYNPIDGVVEAAWALELGLLK